VGALRAEAGDHDVSVRSYDQGRFEKMTSVSALDVAQRATA
jgi:hypothetical protein